MNDERPTGKNDAGPAAIPAWADPRPWLDAVRTAGEEDVRRALGADAARERELAALLSPAAAPFLEAMARRAAHLTQRHFGRTIVLYTPLYLSDYCPGGCLYCGFAADRRRSRRRLDRGGIRGEMKAIKGMGIEEVLLLTGERTPEADFEYLRAAVSEAARHVHTVTVEAFAMTTDEYRLLAEAGCVGVTLYQETYDPGTYARLHRWGGKRDYLDRLDAPARALAAGMRWSGLGVLLGLSDPWFDLLALYRHVRRLRLRYWRAGVTLSFPRVCPQDGGYRPGFPVCERTLAQIIMAFRICLPDVPLVLSTRERPAFRDGMAGLGISRMSVASRTTVGGYGEPSGSPDGQFHVNDTRDVAGFRAALRGRGLEAVFKNWDRALL